MASTPSARLRWLLPVPGGPTRCRTSVRSMNFNSASAMMRFLSREGWNEKSKLASVLMVDSLTMTSAVLMRRFSRRVSSSVSRASMASSALISPRSSCRTVASRISTAHGLKMPCAIEILDATVRQLERGEMSALEAIDALLTEELTLRENRRIKTALVMARLSTIKTLASFDFSFQPSLDKNRIMALAELKFIDRTEVLHLVGPPGTGKSHLSLALGVEAIKAGRSVYFTTLADLVGALAKAEREGNLRERIRFFC